jgi:hypothetical protein
MEFFVERHLNENTKTKNDENASPPPKQFVSAH